MSSITIKNSITAFLSHKRITTLHLAGAQIAPLPESHVVPFPRLEIPLYGDYENELEVNGQVARISLRRGTVLLVPPNCWNRPTWHKPTQVLSLLFGARQMGISLVTADGRGSEHLSAEMCTIVKPHCIPVRSILDTLLELSQHGKSSVAYPDLVMAILRCVEELLGKVPSSTAGRADRLLSLICDSLQEHYLYDITRESIARKFGIAPNHLSRLFRTHGNMSFSQYLNVVRMARAKHMLITYPMKLDEIAHQCGYRDTSYFCRAFRRITGRTPGEFRQEHGQASSQKAPAS